MDTFTEQQFDTGTVTIHFAEGQAAGTPIVMLHGATGRWQNMLPILRVLAQRWHVFALDLRGHGKSGRVPGQYRTPDYVEDIVAFIERRVGEPAILYGHSLGGLVAMGTAAQAPAPVRALILEDPALVEYTHRPEDIFANPYFRGAYDILTRSRSIDDIMTWLRTINPPDTPDEALKARAESLVTLDTDVLHTILNGEVVEKSAFERTLEQITCPVLLLQADPALGAATEDQHVAVIQAHRPGWTMVQIKGANHRIHDSQTEALLKQVIPFIERVESA